MPKSCASVMSSKTRESWNIIYNMTEKFMQKDRITIRYFQKFFFCVLYVWINWNIIFEYFDIYWNNKYWNSYFKIEESIKNLSYLSSICIKNELPKNVCINMRQSNLCGAAGYGWWNGTSRDATKFISLCCLKTFTSKMTYKGEEI